MDTFIAWAKESRKNGKGQRLEHVSFPSFVKNFGLTDRTAALDDYSKLLASSEFTLKRRQALRADHDTFLKNRLHDFWSSWRLQLAVKQAQEELDASSAVSAKKTAVLAQQASLDESAMSYRTLKKKSAPTNTTASVASSPRTVPTDTNDTDGEEKYLDANKQHYESDTDTATDEPRIALSSSSKTHPFHALISYVFKTVQRQRVALPLSAPNDLSGVLREMYSAALNELSQPGPVVAKKDVFVLLSSIINTVASSGRRFSISKKIAQGSRLPLLDANSADYQSIKTLQEDLLTTLYPITSNFSSANHKRKPQFQSLKRRVWTLLSQSEEETAKYTILQIVSQILLWIELDLFASPTSEHVFVSSWSTLFNILLHDTSLRAVPGELVSKASTQARQEAESKYGSTCSTACGRKVDMSLRIRFDGKWQHEVAIFEFKATTATRAMCEKQQKKSVRLNAAILYDLEAKGLDISRSYPIIAEGQALGLDFYALRRYDDVLGAGRSTTKGVTLPSHIDQLKAFFESEAMFILLAFKEHLRQFAYDVTDVLTTSAPTPFGANYGCYNEYDNDENASTTDLPSRPSTPPSGKRRSAHFVLFSPSKKNKLEARTKGPSGDWDDEDDDDD